MKGYINLELNGVKRGVKFGNRALLDLIAKYKTEEGSNFAFSFDLMVDIIYFGMLNNCLVKREDPDFTVDDVNVWADDLPMGKLMEIFQMFQLSYAGEDAKQEAPQTEKKGPKKIEKK